MKEVLTQKKILLFVMVLILLTASGVGYKLYQDKYSAVPKNEAQQLIETVGKIADLPAEIPTIATVTDKEKLKQYQFFQKAEIGDKVLLYNEAKKAYLYRPASGKLIEVGPIMLSDSAEASGSATSTTADSGVAGEATGSAKAEEKKFSLTLLNGTKSAGLATKAERVLEAANMTNIEVKTKSNSKNDYTKTVVVALNNEAKPVAEQIAKELNASVEKLPEGETKPNTEIVVFLGEDRI